MFMLNKISESESESIINSLTHNCIEMSPSVVLS